LSYSVPAIPNSERVYAISADQGSPKRLDLNEISRVLASKNFEFGIADSVQSRYGLFLGKDG